MKNILIVLLGPTGVGKTDLSLEIANHFRCEIISADSRQFYREMKIGTAIPSAEQLAQAKHHFIGFLSICDYYSASLFERDVLGIMPDLFKKNNIVMMVGGSTLYIDAVCYGIDDIPDIDPVIREKVNDKYRKEGIEGIRLALKILDPYHYKKVDLKNPKRIIRALEICESTGKPYSSFLTSGKRRRDFDIIKIGLERPRDELYRRIDSRVDDMISHGLEAEASGLYEMKNLNALNSVGYKEYFDFFDGKTSRGKAIDLIKRDSRRYAKRQMTWWGKDKTINWFNPENSEGIMEFLDQVIGF